MLCVAIETRIDISQSKPGVSCINVAYGVILLSNCIISETAAFMALTFYKESVKKWQSPLWRSDICSFSE